MPQTYEEFVKTIGFKELSIFLSAYSILLGALYQALYWLPFSVNPFEYLSVHEALASSLIPFILVCGLIVLFVFIFSAMNFIDAHVSAPPISRWLKITLGILCVSLGIYVIVTRLLTISLIHTSFVLIGACVAIILAAKTFLAKLEFYPRYLLALFIGMAPFLMISEAVAKIEDITTNSAYHEAFLVLESVGVNEKPLPESNLKHLGHINDFDFFLDKQTTIRIESKRISRLTLLQRHKKSD